MSTESSTSATGICWGVYGRALVLVRTRRIAYAEARDTAIREFANRLGYSAHNSQAAWLGGQTWLNVRDRVMLLGELMDAHEVEHELTVRWTP